MYLTASFITIGPFNVSVFMLCLAVSLDLAIHSTSAISKAFPATAAGLCCAFCRVMPSKRTLSTEKFEGPIVMKMAVTLSLLFRCLRKGCKIREFF